LAVFQGSQLNIYRLPPLNSAEKALHEKEQRALAPLRSATTGSVTAVLAGDGGSAP
jgi:hypothetical protein